MQDFQIDNVVEQEDGARRVTITAVVRQLEGRTEATTMIVSMARREGRLFITGLRRSP